MIQKPATEMRPREILKARDTSSCAFIPVSPLFEWHSWHLPVGCDGLIAETACALAAEKVGGIYFPALSFGLDQMRPLKQLREWGFDDKDKIFGMNFPELPLTSEYSDKAEMLAAVTSRVHAAQQSGFRYVFVVSSHGGHGQSQTLKECAESLDSSDARVVFANTGSMLTLRTEDMAGIGGHAGYAETLLLMAFRPDLVDLDEQPDGPLNVRETGILHHQPEIEAEWNPRNVNPETAEKIRENMVENMVAWVRETAEA